MKLRELVNFKTNYPIKHKKTIQQKLIDLLQILEILIMFSKIV